MKNIFKSLLSIVAAVVLTLSLASCITAQSKLQFTAFPDAEYYVGEMDEEAFLEEVKVSVDGNMTVNDSHKIAGKLKADILEIKNIYDVVVHINPV